MKFGKHSGPLAFTGWTVLGVVLLVVVFVLLTGPQNQDVSAPFTTSSDRFVNVSGQNVSAKLASSGFFVLRQGDRVISGKQTTPPLGWSDKTYFVAEDESFNGIWDVATADSTIAIKLQNATSATVYLKDTFPKWFLGVCLFIAALIVWIVGIAAVIPS